MSIHTITDIRQWVADRYELDDECVEGVSLFVWMNVQHPITEDVLNDFGETIDAIVSACVPEAV